MKRALVRHRVDDLGIEITGCAMHWLGKPLIHRHGIKYLADEAAISTEQPAHAIGLDAITTCRHLCLREQGVVVRCADDGSVISDARSSIGWQICMCSIECILSHDAISRVLAAGDGYQSRHHAGDGVLARQLARLI